MSRYKKPNTRATTKYLRDYFPTHTDNLFQIFIKLLFMLCIVGMVCGSIYFVSYYYKASKQQEILEKQRILFANNTISVGEGLLKKQNSDYEAWIRLSKTEINNPIFKTDNNTFYLNHNSLKEKSDYGSLFLDYRCDFKDKNTVIYGNNSKESMMFATLEKLRQLSFYKTNSVITLTCDGKETSYKIYAVFVMNSSKEQDGGNIYSVYQKEFANELTFDTWVNDAKERSLIDTKVDVSVNDKIITLMTSCDDFEDARLVVMARKQREDELMSPFNTDATMNTKPRYPREWYKVRNIDYPF